MHRAPQSLIGRCLLGWSLAACLVACDDDAPRPPLPEIEVVYTEQRTPCAERNPLRNAYFGDLHVHTGYSFDARAYGNPLTTLDAYRFARGEPAMLVSGRTAQLERPLDFVSITEHGDLLGEVAVCTTPGSPAHDSERCVAYRDPDGGGAFDFGTFMAAREPERDPTICGPDAAWCLDAAGQRWAEMIAAAEETDDKSAACRFSALVGYEYTNTRGISNLHRNVIFRTADVIARPIGHFEAPRPVDLWRGLASECLDRAGCDVLALPHNSNLSNGHLFTPTYPDAEDEAAEREIAALRARLEPVVEIFQHKGDSECRNGFPDVPDDPRCAFEKLRPPTDPICDRPGAGGMRLLGCVHRLDFVRNVWLEGLAEQSRLGIDPYRLGVIGSTDTHNGTPGHVVADDFPGHVGIADDTDAERLGEGNATHDGDVNNPGGLAGVWAFENSRDAIFEAIRRRETFATSGPRMRIRLFAGAYPDAMCADPDRLRVAYADGVPMGQTARLDAAPALFVEAQADDGGARTPLAAVEIIKGWIDADGNHRQRVYTVAGEADAGADFDGATCGGASGGVEALCAVWRDPDPSDGPAFYYARAIELPTCRWSARACDRLTPDERPPSCETLPRVVRQRAWSSPVWVE